MTQTVYSFLALLLISSFLSCHSFKCKQTLHSSKHQQRTALKFSNTISNLQVLVSKGSGVFNTDESTPLFNSDDASSLLIIALGIAILLSEPLRPVGSCRESLVDVRKSKFIPNGGLGVIAKRFIPKDTVIGRYPGLVKNNIEAALNSKANDIARMKCRRYIWSLNDGTVIDPTNKEGDLDVEISMPIVNLFKVPTILARVNEPPVGKDVNVYVQIQGTKVEFLAERDIFAEEELFIDYGEQYDRSTYFESSGLLEPTQPEELARLRQQQPLYDSKSVDNDVMDVEPVLLNRDPFINNSKAGGGRDGKRLSTEEEEKEARYKEQGILSPDEMARMFGQRGAEMFSSSPSSGGVGLSDDQELLESMLGGMSTELLKEPKEGAPAPQGGGEREKDSKKRKQGEEEFENMLQEMLAEARANTAKSTSSNKGFGSNNNSNKPPPVTARREVNTPTPPLSGNLDPRSYVDTPIPSPLSSSKKAPLTAEEIARLEANVDTMSDEEVMKLLTQLQGAMSEKVRNDYRTFKKGDGGIAGKQTMPRAPPIDPAIRAKYGKELGDLEQVLEDMYRDPITAWQTMLKDSAKLIGEGQTDDAPIDIELEEERLFRALEEEGLGGNDKGQKNTSSGDADAFER